MFVPSDSSEVKDQKMEAETLIVIEEEDACG